MKKGEKGFAHLLVILLLLIGLGAGVYLITNPSLNILKSRASNPPIVFKDSEGRALVHNKDDIPVTSSQKIKIELTSPEGLTGPNPSSNDDQISNLPTRGPSISNQSGSFTSAMDTLRRRFTVLQAEQKANIQPATRSGGMLPETPYTFAYKIAEDRTSLDTALVLPYTQTPTIIDYEFADKTPGVKFIWVEFRIKNPGSDLERLVRESARIELASVESGSCTDLAKGKEVQSSGYYQNKPEKAVDGDDNTTWSTNQSTGAWMYVDLGSAESINKVRMLWGWDTRYGEEAKSQVEVSTDAAEWKAVGSMPKFKTGGQIKQTLEFPPVSARYVRFYALQWNRGWGYLNSLEVYKASCDWSPTPTPEPTCEWWGCSTTPIPTATPRLTSTPTPTRRPAPEIVAGPCDGKSSFDTPGEGAQFYPSNTVNLGGWGAFCSGPNGTQLNRVDFHLCPRGSFEGCTPINGATTSVFRPDVAAADWTCGNKNPNDDGWNHSWIVPNTPGDYTLRSASINDAAGTCVSWSEKNITIIPQPSPIRRIP